MSGIVDLRTLGVIRRAPERLGIELAVVGRDGDRPWAIEAILNESHRLFAWAWRDRSHGLWARLSSFTTSTGPTGG